MADSFNQSPGSVRLPFPKTRSLVVALFLLSAFLLSACAATNVNVALPFVALENQIAAQTRTSHLATQPVELPIERASDRPQASFVEHLPSVTTQAADAVSQTLHLPLVSAQVALSTRLGFGSTAGSLANYPEIESLRTGWYLNWNTQKVPVRPAGIEFAQMIRVHQDLECPVGTTPDRIACPYTVPHSYTYHPNAATITGVAVANPGALWLLGNEMDRMDWFGSNQDEMLPEVYAVAYHELYTLIKGADPLARIAIGGVVQPTPLRLEYLAKVWDTYQQTYGQPMPVDVWNIHAFILREKLNEWGASIPPGSTATVGEHNGPNFQHIDMTIFDKQIRAFRQWMKDRGQQEKPLIVTEYGVLYHNSMMGLPNDDAQTPINFMIATFDYFLNEADCSLGYSADDCRLVQRWVWFSVDHKVDFNEYHYLFDPDTKEITLTGKAFRDYSLRNLNQLSKSPY